MTAKHTPGPIRAHFCIKNQRCKTGEWAFFGGPHGMPLLKNNERSRADAERLARCWNSHDDLLAALREAEIALMHCAEVTPTRTLPESALATVRAAIAKAEGV